jgi:hypothetical protein
MTQGETAYLIMTVAAFVIFGASLAWVSWISKH